MRAVRPAGPVFFPLDEELELLPGDLTPSLVEHLVPLVGGEWAEVKTLALGVVQELVVNRRGEPEVHTTALSYFSRLTDHETCGRLATVETHRRGTETAGVVCAVVDGAEWEQGFIA